MGDFPGTVDAEPAPEAFQGFSPSPSLHQEQPAVSDRAVSSVQHRRELQQKRSSLPPQPHGTARHAKRLTLNFPINIVPGSDLDPNIASPGSMTPVTFSSARPSPAAATGTPVIFDGEDDGSSLLTAIASQERKVLELREELQRAEAELDTLKKQWASSETTKKRTEINHRAEPLVPLRSSEEIARDEPSQHRRERSAGTAEGPATVQARLSRDLERRQSLRVAVHAGTSISANGRRVFQGSHARTLSLLSPASSSGQPGSDADGSRATRTPRSATLPSVERSTALENVNQSSEDVISQWRRTMPPPSREALVRTGKQMASDLREGLWTFLEDIRQATVGEEGISATQSRGVPPPRNRDSSSTSRSRDRLSVHGGKLSRSPSSTRGRAGETKLSTGKDTKSADIDVSFWSEFGIDTPGQKSVKQTRGASNTPHGATEQERSNDNLDVEDNWEDWDTPQPKKMHTPSSSRSTLESKHDQSPMTQTSSPRTSGSFGDWRATHDDFIPDPSVSDGIPWPAITKFAPSKLTRTASNLMDEWERSLSPSPDRTGQTSHSPLGKDDKKE
ncbi:DUF4048 domain-containing protein [Aspergillus clavatus NRRL 1]|uniref:DUF4048 domain-containing protein n=1 Tax=Aspergillus clavatus (strain ATCC 1007 / CBS 513.65 / DSM 816 / NCTC 3887 / NRRL 1 / QM 1276 / 107) TaxID=344612 RepID=A1C5C4_ASPCL|nr:uncharacterized protein ACLA_003030 [Aspergillus clavatus NRRL 1]EAW14892.1 conserved hypothetical protein [Aspergillus clavatus NRRL 1]